jgi:TonB family protein
VTKVVAIKSTGNPVLDNAAMSAFRQWQFIPSTLSGKPIGVPVTFTMTGAQVSY